MMIEQYWPTMVGKFNMDWTDSELSELIKELYSIEQNEIDAGKDLHQFSMSGNGYHTQSNLFCNDSLILQKLRITIEDEFNKFAITTAGRILPPNAYTHAWAMISRGDAMSKPHVHPGALFSGVMYIKIPDTTLPKDMPLPGAIYLQDPRPGASFSQVEPSIESVSFNPEAGTGFIFPAWLQHFVTPTLTNEERICISVNLYLPTTVENMTYIDRELKNELEYIEETT